MSREMYWDKEANQFFPVPDVVGSDNNVLTNADRIRSMTDEELAELIGDNIDCSICKNDVFRTTTCPRSLTADGKDCYGCWLAWLREEATDEQS